MHSGCWWIGRGEGEVLAGVWSESGVRRRERALFYIIIDNSAFRNCCVITVSTLSALTLQRKFSS